MLDHFSAPSAAPWDTFFQKVLRAILLLVCLTPLVYADTIFPFMVSKALYARTLIEVAFVIWLLLAIQSKAHRPPRCWVLMAIAAWFAVSTAAAFSGVSPERSLWSTYARMTGVVDLAHWSAYVLMAASTFRTQEAWRQLLGVNVLVSVVVAFIAIAQYWVPAAVPFLVYQGRATATLGSGLFLGAYACINIGFAATLATSLAGNRKVLVLLSAAAALNLLALWISASRSPLVITVLMAIVLATAWGLLNRSNQRRRIALGILGAGAAVILILSAIVATGAAENLPGTMGQRLGNVGTGKDRANSGRAMAAIVALDAFKERPVLGYGPENFEAAWGKHYRPGWDSYQFFDHAHNKLLEVAATAGSLGLAAYSGLLIAILIAAGRAIRRQTGRERLTAIAMATTTAGYLALGMFMLDEPAGLLQFAIIAAYWSSRSSTASREAGFHGETGVPRMFLAASAAAAVALLISWSSQINASMLAGAQVARTQNSWELYIEDQQRLTRAFPPMANERRLSFMSTVQVMAESGKPIPAALDEEAEAAIRLEPYNWRLPFMAALAHQTAAVHHPEHAECAERYVSHMERIAPDSQYTLLLQQSQRRLEAHKP